MTRPSRRPRSSRLPAIVALAAALLVAGCASQPRGIGGDEADESPADAYTQLGMAYLERDNLRRAMGALDRALEIAPDDPEALQAMAMAYQRQGESELADETFRKALSANPDFTRGRNNYAAFLYDRGRVREACEQLDQASKDPQYPNRAQLFANLGQCRRDLGDIEAARDSLRRAQEIDSRATRSYFTLAELEYAEGNLERAREQIEAFMRLAGSRPEALRLASKIARDQGDTTTAAFYTEQLEGER